MAAGGIGMGVALRYKYTALYILLIPILGLAFIYLPLITFPDSSVLSPAAFLVGFAFVLRDFVQREIGHKVIYAMLLGTAINFVIADPAIAIAGALAFLLSETVDWLVYSYTKFELATRIWLSSLLAVPVDSIVVLYGLSFTFTGIVTFGNLLVLTVAKFLVACAIATFVTWKK
jgi:queuosine precursor transporter